MIKVKRKIKVIANSYSLSPITKRSRALVIRKMRTKTSQTRYRKH